MLFFFETFVNFLIFQIQNHRKQIKSKGELFKVLRTIQVCLLNLSKLIIQIYFVIPNSFSKSTQTLCFSLASTELNVLLNLWDFKAVFLCSLARVITDSQLLSASPGKTQSFDCWFVVRVQTWLQHSANRQQKQQKWQQLYTHESRGREKNMKKIYIGKTALKTQRNGCKHPKRR